MDIELTYGSSSAHRGVKLEATYDEPRGSGEFVLKLEGREVYRDVLELVKQKRKTTRSPGMTTYNVPQSELTSDCWPVQIQGLDACETCEFKGTEECGGTAILKKIEEGTFPEHGIGKKTSSLSLAGSALYMRANSDMASERTMTGNKEMTLELTYGSYPDSYKGVTLEATFDKATGEFILTLDGQEIHRDTVSKQARIARRINRLIAEIWPSTERWKPTARVPAWVGDIDLWAKIVKEVGGHGRGYGSSLTEASMIYRQQGGAIRRSPTRFAETK
jgi:hypothetical protein